MAERCLYIDGTVDLVSSFRSFGSAYIFVNKSVELSKGDFVYLCSDNSEQKFAFKTLVTATCNDIKPFQFEDSICTKYLLDRSVFQNHEQFQLIKVQLKAAALNSLATKSLHDPAALTKIFERGRTGLTSEEMLFLGVSEYEESFDEMFRVQEDRNSIGLYLLKRCRDKDFCDALHQKAIRILKPNTVGPKSEREELILKASSAMIAINFYQGGLWDEIQKRYEGIIHESEIHGAPMSLRPDWKEFLRQLFKKDPAYSAGSDYVSVPIIMAIVQDYFCQDFITLVYKAIYKNRLSVTYEIEDQEMIGSAVDSFLDSLTGEEDGDEVAQDNLLLYYGNNQQRFKVSKYTIRVLERGLYREDVKDLIVSLVNKMIDHRYYGDMRTATLCPILEENFQKWIDADAKSKKYDPDASRKENRDPERVAYIKKPRLFFRDDSVYVRIPSNDFPSDVSKESIKISIFDSKGSLIDVLDGDDLEIFDLIGGKADKRKFRVNCKRNVRLPHALGGYSYKYFESDSLHYEERKYLFFDENGYEIQPYRDYEGFCFAITSAPISGAQKESEQYDQANAVYITCISVGPQTAFSIEKDWIYFNSTARLGIGCAPYEMVHGRSMNGNAFDIYKEVSALSFESEKSSIELDIHVDGTVYPVNELLISENNSGKAGIYRYFIELPKPLAPGLHKLWVSDKNGILVHSYGLDNRLFAVDPDLIVRVDHNSTTLSIGGATVAPQLIRFDLLEEERVVPSKDDTFSFILNNPLLRYCFDDKAIIKKLPGSVEDALALSNATFLNILCYEKDLSVRLTDPTLDEDMPVHTSLSGNNRHQIYLPEVSAFIQEHPISDLTIDVAGKRIGHIRFYSIPFIAENGIHFDLEKGKDPRYPDKGTLIIKGKHEGEGNLILQIFESGSKVPALKQKMEAPNNAFELSVDGIMANKAWKIQVIGESNFDPFSLANGRHAVIVEKTIWWSAFKFLKVGFLYPVAQVNWENASEKTSGSYHYIDPELKHLARTTVRILSKPTGGICEAILYDFQFKPFQRLGKVQLKLMKDEHEGVSLMEITRIDGGPVFATNSGILDATASVKNHRIKRMILIMKGATLEKWRNGRMHNV